MAKIKEEPLKSLIKLDLLCLIHMQCYRSSIRPKIPSPSCSFIAIPAIILSTI